MLVLSRKVGEELVIGDNVRIVITRIAGNRVAVGIKAPLDMQVLRGELKVIHDSFEDEAALTADVPVEVSSRRKPGPLASHCVR